MRIQPDQKRVFRRYLLADYPLHVTFQNAELQDLFNKSFKAFLNPMLSDQLDFGHEEQGSGHHLDVIIDSVLPRPTVAQALWYQGTMPQLPDTNFIHHASTDESLIVVNDCVALVTHYATRRSRLVALPNYQLIAVHTLLMNAFVDAAHTGGQLVMHAAALALPKRREMVLIHAPSGTGKTTTALMLMAAGFKLASDDMAFILPQETPTVYGLPRSLKVHRNTAKLLPWVEAKLSDVDWNREGERPLYLDSLGDLPSTNQPEALPIAALIRLTRGYGLSEMKPICPVDMLASLAADNVRRGDATIGLLPIDQARFSGYASLVSRVPLFDLVVGYDHASVPGLVEATCNALGEAPLAI